MYKRIIVVSAAALSFAAPAAEACKPVVRHAKAVGTPLSSIGGRANCQPLRHKRHPHHSVFVLGYSR